METRKRHSKRIKKPCRTTTRCGRKERIFFGELLVLKSATYEYSYLIAIKGYDFRQLHIRHQSSGVAFDMAPADLFINMYLCLMSGRFCNASPCSLPFCDMNIMCWWCTRATKVCPKIQANQTKPNWTTYTLYKQLCCVCKINLCNTIFRLQKT